MQISIPPLQVRRSRSDCVHEQVAKRIANVRFTDYVFYAFGAVGYKRRNVGGKRPQICREAIAFADMIT